MQTMPVHDRGVGGMRDVRVTTAVGDAGAEERLDHTE